MLGVLLNGPVIGTQMLHAWKDLCSKSRRVGFQPPIHRWYRSLRASRIRDEAAARSPPKCAHEYEPGHDTVCPEGRSHSAAMGEKLHGLCWCGRADRFVGTTAFGTGNAGRARRRISDHLPKAGGRDER